MSPRRRLLNLVMANDHTGVCSLHHIDLHSRQNNLFYPKPSTAEKDSFLWWTLKTEIERLFYPNPTASATEWDSSSWLTSDKMEQIQPEEPRLSFQSMPGPRDRRLDCVALSESKTVFLDYNTRGGFIYDDDTRCVVTLPSLHESKWYPKCLAAAGAAGGGKGEPGEDDNIFVLGSTMYPAGGRNDSFQFQAWVHRKGRMFLPQMNDWHCDELPPPPYVHDAGYRQATGIGSYGMVGGHVCVSTEGVGTYCFDVASRAWAKACDWALPLSGKVEHVPELGILVGFTTRMDPEDHDGSWITSSSI